MKKNNDKKILLIGLGNIGEEYELTRHNAGFMFIDYLIQRFDCRLTEKKLKDSLIYAYDKLLLAKPQTFMNNSGKAVKELVKWFDIDSKKELIIVHDDLDLELGNFKFQFAKSPRQHNGVKSVEDHLGTDKFHRLRIGIDNRGEARIDGMKYVLEKFKKQELDRLVEVFSGIEATDLINQMKSN